jgi:hypothetical protein
MAVWCTSSYTRQAFTPMLAAGAGGDRLEAGCARAIGRR